MPTPNYFMYMAIVRDDVDGRHLIGKISKVHASRVRDLPKPPAGTKRKVWKCGDKASEDVYRSQGWFPE